MMRRVAQALLLAGLAYALYEDEEHVVSITSPSDFEKRIVKDDSALWVVHFYQGADAPGSEDVSSPQMADAFAEATAELADSLGAKVAAVDLANEAMVKIAKKFSLQTVPVILGFGAAAAANPYTGKVDRKAEYYNPLQNGAFSKTAFKRWVSSKVAPADAVARAAHESDLVKAGAPAAVLLTERATTSALAKSLGLALRGRLSVVEVQVTEDPSPLAAAFGAQESLPRLLASKDAHASAAAFAAGAEAFDGDLKDRAAVLAWLETFALKEKRAPAAAAPEAEGGWPEGYTVATVDSKEAFAKEVTDAEAALVVFKKGSSLAFARKVTEYDGSGALYAVEVDCAFEGPVCGDKPFAAYGFGVSAKKKALYAGADGMKAFEAAQESIPVDDVTLIGSPQEMESFLRISVTAAEDEAAPVGLMVFTAKDEVSPTIRAVARTLLGHAGVRVGYWIHPDQEHMAHYGVRKLPAVLAFYAQERDPSLPMDQRPIGGAPYPRAQLGPPTFQSLTAFVSSVLQGLAPSALEELQDAATANSRFADAGRPKASAPAAKGPVFQGLNTPEAWDARCGPASPHALCAVALLDEHGRDTFADELKLAEGVAKDEQPSPFAFGWVDGACHATFAEAFDVYESSLPTLVAYAPKKERYAALVGRYSGADIRSFLRGVVSGRVKTAPLRAALSPPEAGVDCAAVHAERTGGGDEDALDDDFLAELLAEEAAAKKALEEEAAAESKRLKDELKKGKEAPKKTTKKKKKKKKKAEL